MVMNIKKTIKLRNAISLLILMTAFCTILVNWYSASNALKSSLTEKYLNGNYEYAKKLSLSTGQLLFDMQHDINTLAMVLGRVEISQNDLDKWKEAYNDNFNSLFTTDRIGVVQMMSPQSVEWNKKVQAGTQIKSDLMKQALANKAPFISNPYLSTTGRLMLIVSAPIFDEKENYKGVIDGTVYLDSDGSLGKLLGSQVFEDGSSVFVVDRSGRIIYHPDSSRINESVSDHPLIQNVMQGKNGSAQIVNSRGTEYFSGYAYVENTGWGIISQTPTSVIKKPMHDLFVKVILNALPFLLLILIIGWVLASNLIRPLNTLARFSENAMNHSKSSIPLDQIEMNSRIYEIRLLCDQIHNHLKLLKNQVQQDGLTGLANRRTFDLVVKEWIDHKTPFSLMMIDIDRFKKVNDTYGHLVGDDVIRYLSAMMKANAREEDICFRYGGEEFAILVRNKNDQEAYQLAERLRIMLSITSSPTGQPITVSIGITAFMEKDQHPEAIIERADSALYTSKANGRNMTTIYRNKEKISKID